MAQIAYLADHDPQSVAHRLTQAQREALLARARALSDGVLLDPGEHPRTRRALEGKGLIWGAMTVRGWRVARCLDPSLPEELVFAMEAQPKFFDGPT